MRLRVLGKNSDDAPDAKQIERTFRLGLGSWGGHLRKVDVWVEQRTEPAGGPGFVCRIHATLTSWVDLSVYGLGSDAGGAVLSATRQLVRQIRRDRFGSLSARP